MEPSDETESRAQELQARVARVLEEGLRVLEGARSAGGIPDDSDERPSVVVICPQIDRAEELEGYDKTGPRSGTVVLVLGPTGEHLGERGDAEGGSGSSTRDALQFAAAGGRAAPVAGDLLSVDGLTLDFARHRAVFGGNVLQLTNREFTLLAVLARSRGRVVSPLEIVREFGKTVPVSNRDAADLVKAVVLRTRRKLSSVHADPRIIMTVRGVGYMIDNSGHR